ncbi:hypothetical protein [uncultured Alistipes sp.]|jgi:hypothetical protein|uniref:hypothetical protein n=1 Tax=uncultured Alistipes sp. TaxID=538949 RepID=UPI0025D4EBD4|nr:hypothetical protein [uncultured Alistipes sp.]
MGVIIGVTALLTAIGLAGKSRKRARRKMVEAEKAAGRHWICRQVLVDNADSLFLGVPIFRQQWIDRNETVDVRDPHYKRLIACRVYAVVIDGEERLFAAGEVSNCVWLFALYED